MRRRTIVTTAALALGATALPGRAAATGAGPAGDGEVRAGTFTRIYDPSVGEPEQWYVNDHTIVRGDDGTWHLFGITHAEPAAPEDEDNLAHATAPDLHGPWTKQPYALSTDPSVGETHLWAPYVLRHAGLWYMFYSSGGPSESSHLSLATSPDLWTWTRVGTGILFTDGYDTRDPFVLRVGGRWVLYYTATSTPAGGNHVVAYRTSTDLVHWGDRHVAYTDPSTGTYGGPTESPYVVHHGGRWYLFTGPRPDYVGTDVFVSDDPLHFDVADTVGHIASHAAEVVRDTDGSWWVTHAGWEQGGVYLAPLYWPGR